MRSYILFLIDLVWLIAALGLLVWGAILMFKRRNGWKRGLGFAAMGALAMAARFVGPLWRVIHQCVGA